MNNKALVAIAIMLVFVVPIGLGFLLNMEDVEQRSIVTSNAVDITDILNNGDAITSINYTGPNNNDVLYYKYTSGSETIVKVASPDYVETSDKQSSNPIFDLESDISPSPITVSIDNTGGADVKYVDVPASAGFVYSFSVTDRQRVEINQDTGYSPLLVPPSGSTFYVFVYGSDVYTAKYDAGTGYSMISNFPGTVSIRIGEVQGYSDTIQIMPRNPAPATYGHAAYGWKIPAVVPDNVAVTWFNGFRNTHLAFVVDLGSPGTPHYLYIKNLAIYQNSDGTVEIGVGDPVVLGTYRYLYITFDYDESNNRTVTKTVYGITKWPSMGKIPTTYASYQTAEANSDLDYVNIREIGSRSIFRVDTASILDSTIPVIDNNSYDPLDYYPQSTGYSVKIERSSIDPTSITFGSHTYTVTDRQITVNGVKFNVAGSTFTSIYDNDTSRWINSINGQSIGNSASNPTLSFGGVSSMDLSQSAAGYHIDTYSTKWVPGHFAFDISDYALIGLITSVAAFIILGMAGIRSGGKVLWLAAICGGAAIIFITLI